MQYLIAQGFSPGRDAFLEAIRKDNCEVLQYLLNTFTTDDDLCSEAAETENIAVLGFLLKRGFAVTGSAIAASIHNGNLAILEMLLKTDTRLSPYRCA